MSDIGNDRTGRSDVVMLAAAAQPDAGRTAGVNANVVLAIVAVGQFMVVVDASTVQCCAADDQAGHLARVVTFSRRMRTRLARS
jgi:hypothetical protein